MVLDRTPLGLRQPSSSKALDPRLSTPSSSKALDARLWTLDTRLFPSIDTPVTQAAGQPLGRLPQGSPKGEVSGSERINLYSSGMYVRLAFAVAARSTLDSGRSTHPVDEVLAVGGAEF